MCRKAIATALVFLWVVLSGIDVLEDLDLPDQFELHASNDRPLPGKGFLGRLVNNIIESADHSQIRASTLFERGSVVHRADLDHASRKAFKLHKLYRVFLI